ncbi:uncharacterized protein FTJAE_3044 [Fusarium tjaetaba]|uniref:Uncharacterized protein n=1 Tax=Fusarium tjaetaba TaxID=1567544 RepID=A0A8H5S4I4_9HYPO|nr:uncharacterized protein FTJAE_3044 [Fusarium tjaetaba]KAF5643746.1 hypothetical protein FTJAE_3044 [Fusarium tjaetaba]
MSDARSSERRAPSRHEDEPPAKRKGRPRKADQTSQGPSTAMNRVQARRLVKKYPALKKTGDDVDAFYREIISWRVDSGWDAEDDEAIDAQWERCGQRANSMGGFKKSQHSALLTMFKVCLRLFKSTPIQILSPYHSLRYYPVSNNGCGNRWIYNKTFCDDFTALMVHPFWESDTDLFATALQWTVICRLGDDRLWTGRLNKPCPALDYVYSEVERCDEAQVSLPCSYHEMHVSERDRILERGESPGEWSDLFFQIGDLASKQTEAKPKEDFLSMLGLPVLPVSIRDLSLLTAALDSTELGPQWNYSVKEASQAWKAEKSGAELPAMKDLPLVYEIAWKSVFRHVRVVNRTSESDSSLPSRDDEDIASQDSVHTRDGEDNESEPEIAHQPRGLRRRQIVEDDSEREDEFIPQPPERNDEDDFTGDDLEDDFGFDMPPEESPQSTSRLNVLRSRGPVLSSLRSPRRRAPSVYPSFQEEEMASEIRSLKQENAKLYKLVLDGQKEQRDFMLNVKTQLDSVQSELSELRKAKEAPTRDDNVQGQEESPSPPQVTATVSDIAPQSPDLGTTPRRC